MQYKQAQQYALKYEKLTQEVLCGSSIYLLRCRFICYIDLMYRYVFFLYASMQI